MPKLLDKGNLVSIPDTITEKEKGTESDIQQDHPGSRGVRSSQVRLPIAFLLLHTPFPSAGSTGGSFLRPALSGRPQGNAPGTVGPARDLPVTAHRALMDHRPTAEEVG